jgi:hypothetical protein
MAHWFDRPLATGTDDEQSGRSTGRCRDPQLRELVRECALEELPDDRRRTVYVNAHAVRWVVDQDQSRAQR